MCKMTLLEMYEGMYMINSGRIVTHHLPSNSLSDWCIIAIIRHNGDLCYVGVILLPLSLIVIISELVIPLDISLWIVCSHFGIRH